LVLAYAELGKFDSARPYIGEATAIVENQRKVVRGRGQSSGRANRAYVGGAGCGDSASAFERALAVARKQQAKSRELRAAMSIARLWRDQGSAMKPAIL
jgi:hypothetical protein